MKWVGVCKKRKYAVHFEMTPIGCMLHFSGCASFIVHFTRFSLLHCTSQRHRHAGSKEPLVIGEWRIRIPALPRNRKPRTPNPEPEPNPGPGRPGPGPRLPSGLSFTCTTPQPRPAPVQPARATRARRPCLGARNYLGVRIRVRIRIRMLGGVPARPGSAGVLGASASRKSLESRV